MNEHPKIVPATVAIGVATRALKAGEVVMQGDVIVQGYAQVSVDVPPELVRRWQREARWRHLRRSFARLGSLRIGLIHLLGGIDPSEQDGHE